MNRTCIHLSLDPGAVAALTMLAEEQRLTLADLIRDVLDRHLDDLRHRRAEGGADAGDGETFAYTMQQQRAEGAEEFDPLRAWLRLSPEARWYAAERGLVQPPWAELEAAETADDPMPV